VEPGALLDLPLTQAHRDAAGQLLQAQQLAEVAEARRNAPSATLLPPLGLGAFAALAQRAALVVCNDSGVSHVAA
ncbi:glycosyltransferase family 9 protein, partial [Bordetella pertussis]|uniref:glycosyltransferase family 9 protein n=1 Tax=Bordetella pertussis TaxID=520 RepID=UPI0021CC459A